MALGLVYVRVHIELFDMIEDRDGEFEYTGRTKDPEHCIGEHHREGCIGTMFCMRT